MMTHGFFPAACSMTCLSKKASRLLSKMARSGDGRFRSKLPRQMTLTNRWTNRIIAFQSPLADFNRNPRQPRDFSGKLLVEKIPAQPLRDFFTDGAGARAELLINEKELFHIITMSLISHAPRRESAGAFHKLTRKKR